MDLDQASLPLWLKHLKSLQNKKVCDIGSWFVALGMWGLPSLDLLNVKVKFAS